MIGVAPPSLLDVVDKELVLQVRGSSRQGEIVRLKSRKCTIGSGPRCTLRLRARGVRPLHCLVLRGEAGTVIRRLAPDTRLNGLAFTDAELVPGDRLGVGPLEFEVLESNTDSQARLDQCDTGLNQRAGQIDRARAHLESERRALEEQRRAWDADRAASESRASGESEQIEARLAELTAQREALEQEIQRHKSEQAETERRLRERAGELDARQRELDVLQAGLDMRQKEIDGLQSEIDARQAGLDTRRKELDARQADLDARESEIGGREADLDARQSELDARQAELDARESQIDQSRRQMEIEDHPVEADTWSVPELESQGPDQNQDIRSDEPSRESPESGEEVLARLGMTPSYGDAEADEPPPATPEPSPSNRGEAVDLPVESEGDQDESIDDYMVRLLDRVRETTGGPNESMPSHSEPEPTIDDSPPPASIEAPEDGLRDTPASAATPREAAEPSPRAQAPEKSVDMAAMRELANFSARAAINSHARRTLFGSVVSKLVVALAGFAAAAILTWIWWNDPTNTTVLCAAAISFVVVLLWGVEYVLLRGYAALRKSGPGEWNDAAGEHAAGDLQPEEDTEESL